MVPDLSLRLIDAAVATIETYGAELTELDQAIGDGDHGINMKRGFDAVAATRKDFNGLSLPEALQKLGMTLVMKVGGASGPLYGSLFMAMGKALDHDPTNLGEVAAMVTQGVEAVKKRGRSEAGEKTMLDVLVPVSDLLQSAPGEGWAAADLLGRVRDSADAGLEATRDIVATKGRASYLGERAIGHLDPGARSSQLLIRCLCDVVADALTSEPAGPP